MADAADKKGKLDKLARLKSLKSGLKTSEKAAEETVEPLSLDAMLAQEGLVADPTPDTQLPKPEPGDSPPPKPAPKAAEADGDSLSSYFEALGIVPDSAKVDGATGKAPVGYSAPSDAYTAAAGKKEPGRDVDERDLWADPVRNDDTFLSSFAAGVTDAPESDDDSLSLDSIIGSFEDDEDDGDAPAVESEPEKLDNPVDIEAFEAEIALKENEITEDDSVILMPSDADATEPETDAVEADKPLTITFDESRATLLAHVSKQMNCTVDDVVVTAIDWYLDALFGEDDPDMTASQGD